MLIIKIQKKVGAKGLRLNFRYKHSVEICEI